jgi:hypothetical protein
MIRMGHFSGGLRLKLMMLLLGLVLFALCKPAEGREAPAAALARSAQAAGPATMSPR